jgi:hypothetical protein
MESPIIGDLEGIFWDFGFYLIGAGSYCHVLCRIVT